MNIFLISVAILTSVVIWPINRWVTRHGGRPAVYGFWLCLMGALSSGAVILLTGKAPLVAQPAVWAVGLAIGVAFAFGFCLVVMYCLRIGPAGPTVVMNNMGMVWPVLMGVFWPRPHGLTALTVIGIALVLLALVGFGFSRPRTDASTSLEMSSNPSPNKAVSFRWAFWAFLAWVLSGISQGSQYVGSMLVPDGAVVITFAYNSMATLVLIPFFAHEMRLAHAVGQPALNLRETAGGLVNGVILVAGLTATLTVLTRVGPEIIYPFTVAGPMIVVLLLGQYVYRERLDRIGWLSCGLGVIGLLALSLGQVGT